MCALLLLALVWACCPFADTLVFHVDIFPFIFFLCIFFVCVCVCVCVCVGGCFFEFCGFLFFCLFSLLGRRALQHWSSEITWRKPWLARALSETGFGFPLGRFFFFLVLLNIRFCTYL